MQNSIINFYIINSQLSVSGQPSEQDFVELADASYSLVINLAMSDSDNALKNQYTLLATLNLDYHHIPVTWNAPNNTDVLKVFNVLENNKDKKTLVHCAYNYRASAFLYLYQKHILKLSDSDARQAMDLIWQPNKIRQQFIDNFSY